MEPIKHPIANRTIRPPKDWNPADGECASLEVYVQVLDGGGMLIQSAWKPSEEELAALNAGCAVCLGVFGTSIPPMYVGVFAPEVGTYQGQDHIPEEIVQANAEDADNAPEG